MIRKLSAIGALLVVATVGPAHAALVQIYSSASAFLVQNPVPNADRVTFGPTGPGVVIDLTGSAASASAGSLTLSASPGDLFGNSTMMSTDTDQATLILTFSQALHSLGFSAFVSDSAFGFVDGSLTIDVAGSGSQTVITSASGPTFIGFDSDVDFTSVTITIASFDSNVTAVAFPTLIDTVYPALTAAPIPSPGLVSLLVPAVAMSGVFLRRSWRRRSLL